MKTIATYQGDQNGYEWSEIRIYSSGAMTLAVDGQSGCSCNSYEEPPERELEWWHTAEGFYRAVKTDLDAGYFFTDAQRGEIMLEARKLWDERMVHE